MSSKAKLVYFDGRGRMESVRWVMAAAGIEFEEQFIKTRDDYQKLLKELEAQKLKYKFKLAAVETFMYVIAALKKETLILARFSNTTLSFGEAASSVLYGVLLYEQVPMVEIDGMHLVQTRAIINYVASKGGLQPSDRCERAHVDMYVEGMRDLGELMLPLTFLKSEDLKKKLKEVEGKASARYLPVYEKVLGTSGGGFLVGTSLTVADVLLLELLLMLDERFPQLLSSFPHLQAFKERVSQEPNIKRFLEPGSQRKPIADEVYLNTVRTVYNL